MYTLLENFKIDAAGAPGNIDEQILSRAAGALNIPLRKLHGGRILNKSVDARRGRPQLIYTVLLSVDDELPGIKSIPPEKLAPILTPPEPELPDGSKLQSPIVVGTGPAGIFAALALAMAGCRPLVLDRGFDAQKRYADYLTFLDKRVLNEESNLLIGEGGAGTFSDGKLYTGTRDPLAAFVLKTFIEMGAPPEIGYLKRPHIGSDHLRKIAVALRRRILELGGEFRFGSGVVDIVRKNGRCTGVRTAANEIFEAPATLIAAGLGGRMLTRQLIRGGEIGWERKPFQLGCRIEHPQSFIDRHQYHWNAPRPAALGAAEYHMTSRPGNGTPGVSTFCMCPGGEVLNATAWKNHSLTNGMSDYARAGEFGNSCLIVTLAPEPAGSLEGDYALLDELEQNIFTAGGGDYTLPAQDAAAFLAGRNTLTAPQQTSCRCGIIPGRLDLLLPQEVAAGIRAALRHFDHLAPGFLRYGKLIGMESCVSSPVRFLRNPENGASTLPGLWLGGEGAGAAGGIMSAAVDGLRLAEKMLRAFC